MNFNININRDESDVNDFLYLWDVFKKRPSKIVIQESFNSLDFLSCMSSVLNGQEIVTINSVSEIMKFDEGFMCNRKVLSKLTESIYISYVEVDNESENYSIRNVIIFYIDKNVLLDTIVHKLSESAISYDDDNYSLNRLNTVILGPNGLDLDPIHINDELNIKPFYNKKTFKELKSLHKKINDKLKGITILHGEVGTGKTEYIKYLSTKLKKMSIFIPNSFIEITINNPEFHTFLRKYENVAIIIDNCDFHRTTAFSNNIVQLVDSVVSDNINIHVIMLYNESNIHMLDDILTESNNIVDIIKFEKLTTNESNKLADILKIEHKFDSETKLHNVVHANKKVKKRNIGI